MQRFSRRQGLVYGAGGLAALLASRWFLPAVAHAEAAASLHPGAAGAGGKAAKAQASKTKAKACIVLWLNGGPSHIDTFDPKSGVATARFKAVKTRSKNLFVSEHLPLLADHGDKLAVVRSMTSKEGNHDRARYLLHTGYVPNPTVHHPSLGGWVSHEVGEASPELPNFVSIGGPSLGPGFLGLQHGPFIVDDPAKKPANVALPRDVDEARFRRREEALRSLETRFEPSDPQITGRHAIYEQSTRMMRSPKLAAFEVEQEPEAVRRAYGDTKFGRGCLAARRLVESGVKLVEVVLDGWDTHQDNFERTKKLMSVLDPAFSALLGDLHARKLLDSTLVVCLGEFGRTPKINAKEGRDHYPGAWSCALAGGGIRGGIAYGKTDPEGAKVVENPVTVPNLFATLTTQLGIDPNKVVTSPIGRPIGVTDEGEPVRALIA
ncbi:DUF1501 domain-containing protein [Pendulispora albinea]|uniref:DUF1501 domain-containing protein n=1 Tax=Pendulispora albinea TaxID=2741071 RepID=A0ABZ2LQ16_9BACT